MTPLHEIAGQARNDAIARHCGLDPQSTFLMQGFGLLTVALVVFLVHVYIRIMGELVFYGLFRIGAAGIAGITADVVFRIHE
jgi:hypothetical protein